MEDKGFDINKTDSDNTVNNQNYNNTNNNALPTLNNPQLSGSSQPYQYNIVDMPAKKMKGSRFWPGFGAGVLMTFVIVLAYSFITYSGSKLDEIKQLRAGIENGVTTGKASAVNNNYKLDMDKIGRKLNKLQKIVNKSYLFEEDLSAVEEGIYAGFMKGLGDPYSVYYTKEEYSAIMETTTGVYQGIGASVSKNPTTGITTITKVFKGSPAEEAGLVSGDIIYKINGEEVTSLELDVLVQQHIRGEEGSSFEMTILRGENAKELTFTLTRKKIEVPTVESRMLQDNIGYISVAQFEEPTSEQFKAAVEELKGQGMQRLIIDLRDNPGGLLYAVVDMLDYVLPEGLVVYTADKDGIGQKYYSDKEHVVNIPAVVLLNGNSASASEVFSGAVKDFKWAKLVGTKTFGKGIVQNFIPLSDGSAVKVTHSHYYTPSGFDLHGKGIEPDIKVELDENAVVGSETDNQLKTAIEAVKEIAPMQ